VTAPSRRSQPIPPDRADGDQRQASAAGAGPGEPDTGTSLTERALAGASHAAAVRDRVTARLPPPATRGPAADLTRLRAAHTEAAAFYRDQLHSAAGAHPRAYLTSRGGAAVLAAGSRWAVGYAPPGWTALTRHLRGLGFRDHELLTGGLATRSRHGGIIDVFRDRVTFGVHNPSGHLVGFIARAAPHAPGGPRYLNTAQTPLFAKGQLLFGLWEQLPLLADPTRPVLLVEGSFDVLATVAAGQTQPGTALLALAPSGTALTRAHAELLDRTAGPVRPVIAAFDADPAGLRAADRAFTLLGGDLPPDIAHDRPRRPLYHLTLPTGADPADILTQHGPAGLQRLLTDPAHRTPLVDTVLDYRTSPWANWVGPRIRAGEVIAPVIAAQPPTEITRLVIRTAARLDLHPNTVTTLVVNAITTSYQTKTRRDPAPRHLPRSTSPGAGPTPQAATAAALRHATNPTSIHTDIQADHHTHPTPASRPAPQQAQPPPARPSR